MNSPALSEAARAQAHAAHIDAVAGLRKVIGEMNLPAERVEYFERRFNFILRLNDIEFGPAPEVAGK